MTQHRSLTAHRLREQGLGAFFRPRDLRAMGVSYPILGHLLADGAVEKLARGLYRFTAIPANELETIAMVAAVIPTGIVCLISALQIHGIGTQTPHEVWMAIAQKARKPARTPARVRIVRFSGPMLNYGVKTRDILGVPTRVTSPARTIVDCFRYRNKVGLDAATEALRDALRSRRVSIEEIVRTAEVCRARTILRPYLEAMTA